MIEINPLRPGDRDAWEVLARGYRYYWHTREDNARGPRAAVRQGGPLQRLHPLRLSAVTKVRTGRRRP